MNKKILALVLAGISSVTILGYWAKSQAQSSPYELKDPTYIPPKPISLPANPKSDGTTSRPKDRQQADKPDEKTQVLIGADKRIPVLTRRFPWSAIGRIDWVIDGKEVDQCTGTLIGRDLVLTNSHCLVDDTKQPTKNRILFKPSLINGRSLDSATVVSYNYGWKSGSQDDADDWALLKIDKPLGDIYGYLGWRVLDFSDKQIRNLTKDQIRLVGYTDDFPAENPGATAGAHTGCSIEGVGTVGDANAKVLNHNCDTSPGSSGGPLFALFNDGNYYIIGLNSGDNWRYQSAPDRSPARIRQIANRGVQVSRWAVQAMVMRQGQQK